MLLTQWLLQDSTLFILNIIIGYHRMEFKHFNFSKSCGTQHGHLEYFNMNKYDWIQWDNLHSIPLLNYIATISLLVNTLLLLLFLREKDASLILGSLWTIQKGSMVLSRQHSIFYPLQDWVVKHHLWVLFPSLPFPLWNKDFLTGLTNCLGCFMVVEKDFHQIFDDHMTQFLVEMDVSKGNVLIY